MAIFKIIDYKPLFYYEGINHVEDTIKNAIRYVTNPISNPNQIYRGYNFLCTTPDDIITQFIAVSRYYGKRDYIPIRHLVLSLNPYNFEYRFEAENLRLIVDRFCMNTFANEYQVLYGIHEDSLALHAHIVINTVGLRTRRLLSLNHTLIQELEESMKLYLKLNNYHKGPKPIKSLTTCYD